MVDTTKKVRAPTGQGNRGRGRKKGVPNKVTTEFRETIRNLLEKNEKNISKWLDQVAEQDPSKALDHIGKLAEYAAPKLSRAEVTGDGGGPVKSEVKHTIEIVDSE